MKDLIINNKNYKILIDNTSENENIFLQNDLDFLKSKDLIKEINKKDIRIRFVGEIITPNYHYISLPKKFNITEDNVILIKKTLNKYKNLKKDGKSLIENYSFSPDNKGELSSDIFYFNKLKEYFLDYITYEFIYPKEKNEIHSNEHSSGDIDVPKTDMNIDRYGYGITYKIKDIKNNPKWNLDDIYYTTILKLSELYGSENDKLQIDNMIKFLKTEGYNINEDSRILQDNMPVDDISKDIKKIDVDDIHYPIKNALINYYESTKIKNKHTIFAFHTTKFQYAWEYFSKIALFNDDDFRRKMKKIMLTHLKLGEEHELNPDIFSNFNNKKFIGDSKYYWNFDNDFSKELYQYNQATEYVYPIVVFIPSTETKFYDPLNKNIPDYSPDSKCELIRILLSLEDVISDVINDTKICINKVQPIIKKLTDRVF
jgi:hypothetical protein